MSAVIDKIEGILTEKYSADNYVALASEILDGMRLVSPNNPRKEFTNFSSHIESSTHVGNYLDPDGKKIIIMAVELKRETYVENSRSTQRSYAKKLIESGGADAALIAFYTPGDPRWRLSFVRLDYEMKIENGKLKTAENITPARRYSFLVGKDEPCHTAIDRFRAYLENYSSTPTLDDLENAFSVEAVTKEFFDLYCEKFLQLRECLENNQDFIEEAKLHNYTSAQFAKKLMGQIVFLYFLQKKGWLGVKAWPTMLNAADYKKAYFSRGVKSRELIPMVYTQVGEDAYHINAAAIDRLSDDDETFLSTCVKGEPWGTGPHNFMRRLFELSEKRGANFFDDFLEPLFYDALNVNRGEQGYDPALHCRIPFLSGGLFEPIDGYEWKTNNFAIPNELFSNKKDHKDRLADGILDIFDRYNFTMCEDEPLEREVAIDPEMLGKVFENLLDVNDRKSKGAFYTPREIVHYMCQESLINYLTNTMQVSESAIRDFILYGDFMKDEDASVLKRAEKGDSYDLWVSDELYQLNNDGTIKLDRMVELDKALQDVRIADPAVGSGAFPLGMLNEIVRARQNITTYLDISQKIIDPKGAPREIRYRRINDRSARKLKYETIRNCIFAVDIEPSAVDIAQLRLWLALVIDDEITPNAVSALDGHINPLPLPNLECNILCGNSLVDEFEGVKLVNESDIVGTSGNVMQTNIYQSAFDMNLERLISKQDELFRCDNTDRKKTILQDISALRDELIQSQLNGISNEQRERYEATKAMASKPFTLWQLDFARVFREKGGFDIVIGNPPYIQLQKTINDETHEKLGDAYASLGFASFAKTGDIYCLFYEKGFSLLHPNGALAFITSNKWMRAGYGEKLRKFFAENTNPLILIDFANQKIFESATVDVNILLFQKSPNLGKTKACMVKENCTGNLSVYIQQSGACMPFCSSESWVVLNPIEQSIKKKIETQGTPLNKWNVSINYGIKTGLNDAFIVSGEVKDQLIAEDSKSAEIIRPILRGRDIKRYNCNYADLWVLYIPWHFPLENDDSITGPSEEAEKMFREQYPAVYTHLLRHKEELSKRNVAETGIRYEWYALQRWGAKYRDDFSKPKIVYREISDAMDACLVAPDVYINNKCYMITGEHLEYILSFLNSKLFTKIVLSQANVTGGKGEGFLSAISLIPPTDDIEKIIHDLFIRKEEGLPQSDFDKAVENIFCDLYGLNEEERHFIYGEDN